MAKLTLADLASLQNETSAMATINANNALIETALENTLSRDGTAPNQMEASLDMNSQRILNLPTPLLPTEPARLIDLTDFDELEINPIDGTPVLIVVSGQSNVSNLLAYSWVPPPNLFIWDRDDTVATDVGSAFVQPSGTHISLGLQIGAMEAWANPTRPVYVVNVGYGGLDISEWLVGGSPDMYAALDANVTAAVANLSMTSIDVFVWWQGESDAALANTSYVSNFSTFKSRLELEPWWNYKTPIIVHGISPWTGDLFQNYNRYLSKVVSLDPGHRRFVNVMDSPQALWEGDEALPYIHAKAAGLVAIGSMSWNAWRGGTGINLLSSFNQDFETGNILFGGPVDAIPGSSRFEIRNDVAGISLVEVSNRLASAAAQSVFSVAANNNALTLVAFPSDLAAISAISATGAAGLNIQTTTTGSLLFGVNSTTKLSLKTTGVVIPNNVALQARNQADAADVDILKLTTGNNLMVKGTNILLTDAAETAFGLLQLGGTSSSFPAIKRSTTGLEVKLADDSAYTTINSLMSTTRVGLATPAAASAVPAFRMGTDLVGIYFGTGSPNTALTAPKGSLYIRTDGSSSSTRVYVNTDASTAWTNITTAA